MQEEIEALIELSENNRRKQGNTQLYSSLSQLENKKGGLDSIELRHASDIVKQRITAIE